MFRRSKKKKARAAESRDAVEPANAAGLSLGIGIPEVQTLKTRENEINRLLTMSLEELEADTTIDQAAKENAIAEILRRDYCVGIMQVPVEFLRYVS